MNQKLPQPTGKEYQKLENYEQRSWEGGLSEMEEEEYLDLLNSFDWSAEIFSKDGKYGIISAGGKLLVPAIYDEFICIMRHVEYLKIVVAAKSGKYGLVRADGTGFEITGFTFDYMAPWLGSATAARTGNKWNYINGEGQKLLPYDLDNILFTFTDLTFENGISVFMKDGLWGVTDGYDYSKPVFDELDDIEPDGLISGKRDGIKGYINILGEFTSDEDQAWWSATT